MKKIIVLTLALAAMAASAAAADKPDFSGDWTIDAAKSTFGRTGQQPARWSTTNQH